MTPRSSSSNAFCDWTSTLRVSLRSLMAMAGLVLAGLSADAAIAGPNDYIRLPTIEYGEREIDFKTGAHRQRDGSSEAAHSIGYGFTPAAWWFTELYAKYARAAGEANRFDAWEWENRFQLTETGRFPVELGFLLEVERPRDRAEGFEYTLGPMLQSEWGKFQANANVFLRRHWRATERFDSELLYQLQLKYRHSRGLEWGLQGFGNAGQWDHRPPLSQQSFAIGPALFGKIRLGAREAIRWNSAILAGTSPASPRTTLRFQAEYEF